MPYDSNYEKIESSLVNPIPTPYWGSQSGSAFTVRATTTIQAPVQLVLHTLLDTNTWPKWNKFVPKADLSNSDGKLRPGIPFTEHVDMKGRGKPSRTMDLTMTTLEELRDERRGFKVVWVGKSYPDWALRSERVHDVYETDGHAVYDVYETFSGPLAYVVKIFAGKALVERFGQWNMELKEYVERNV